MEISIIYQHRHSLNEFTMCTVSRCVLHVSGAVQLCSNYRAAVCMQLQRCTPAAEPLHSPEVV